MEGMGRKKDERNFKDPWLGLLYSAGEIAKEFPTPMPDNPNYSELMDEWVFKADYRSTRLYVFKRRYLEAMKSGHQPTIDRAKAEIFETYMNYFSAYMKSMDDQGAVLVPMTVREAEVFKRLRDSEAFEEAPEKEEVRNYGDYDRDEDIY